MARFALFAAAVVFALSTGPARSAEPIEGVWRLDNGETVTYAPCGDAYCSRVNSGKYAGKTVGRMTGGGGSYTGTLIDPASDKSYEGRASVSANELVLTGCVAKVFCRSQTWTR